MVKPLIALGTLALLTACGQKRPVLILPPADLATCAPEPDVPVIPGREQQDLRDRIVIDWIAALRTAGADCRAKVDGLRAWREAAE